MAAGSGVEIEFIRKLKAFREEDRIQSVLAERGDHPGLVHVFSAMEACSSDRRWHEKASGKTLFKPIARKCLHYYFYFIDAQLGLCYVRADLGGVSPASLLHRNLARAGRRHAPNTPPAIAALRGPR